MISIRGVVEGRQGSMNRGRVGPLEFMHRLKLKNHSCCSNYIDKLSSRMNKLFASGSSMNRSHPTTSGLSQMRMEL